MPEEQPFEIADALHLYCSLLGYFESFGTFKIWNWLLWAHNLLKGGTKPLQSFGSLCYTATVESQSASEIFGLEEFLGFSFRAKTK